MPSTAAVEGTKLLRSGNFSGAISVFESGISKSGKDLDCRLGLARAHLAREDDGAARMALAGVLSADPHNAEAQSDLALLDFRGGKKDALERLKAASAAPGAGFFEHYNLASALGELKDAAGAKAAYERALAAEPKSPYVHLELGRLALDAKDPVGAVRHFEAAIKLAPKEWVSHQLLSRALTVAGDLANAIVVLERALSLAPRPKDVFAELVKLYLASGKVSEAMVAGQALNQADPADPAGLYLYGVANLAAGKVPEAKQLVEEALKKAPKVPEYRQTLEEIQQILAKAK